MIRDLVRSLLLPVNRWWRTYSTTVVVAVLAYLTGSVITLCVVLLITDATPLAVPAFLLAAWAGCLTAVCPRPGR